MAPKPGQAPEQRRFLAINFRVGTRENSLWIGPALVSTGDFAEFHFWDEACAAELDLDDYEIVKLYPRGLSCDEAARLFTKDFPSAMVGPHLGAGIAIGAILGLGEPGAAPGLYVVAA